MIVSNSIVSLDNPKDMRQLPARIQAEGVLLRCWRVTGAERLERAVVDSAEHLRPWMAWMADEPQTLDQRRRLLARWEQEWASGGDAVYVVLVDRAVAGSCGLHRRLGPAALEIGYWVHAAFLRRRIASKAAALLTDAAFAIPEIERVEIHHDKANSASAGVPRHLGYRFVGEQRDAVTAPADSGVECVWRIERGEWPGSRARASAADRPVGGTLRRSLGLTSEVRERDS
jgi:ribosomal-protein-serine acetyltransferase